MCWYCDSPLWTPEWARAGGLCSSGRLSTDEILVHKPALRCTPRTCAEPVHNPFFLSLHINFFFLILQKPTSGASRGVGVHGGRDHPCGLSIICGSIFPISVRTPLVPRSLLRYFSGLHLACKKILLPGPANYFVSRTCTEPEKQIFFLLVPANCLVSRTYADRPQVSVWVLVRLVSWVTLVISVLSGTCGRCWPSFDL